jgi:hypothetical protein
MSRLELLINPVLETRTVGMCDLDLIRRHIDQLFTIALLLIGGVFLRNYVYAPESHIARPIHGFAIETDGRIIHLQKFAMTLDVTSGELGLFGQWNYINSTRDIGKDFSIMVVLPLRILAYNRIQSFTPSVDKWTVINTNVTGVVASALSAKFTGNLTNQYFVGQFHGEFIADRTYVNFRRGTYIIVLPLNVGIGSVYFPRLESFSRESGVFCCTLPTEIDVYLTFPESAVNIQPFPYATLGLFSRPYDNATMNSAEWTITERTQLTLSYVDQTEQSYYEISVILGSLLVGAGISGIADGLRQYSTAKRETRRQSSSSADE